MIWMDLAKVQEHAESTLPRDDEFSVPVGWILGHKDRPSTWCQSHESLATMWDAQVKFLENDGFLS